MGIDRARTATAVILTLGHWTSACLAGPWHEFEGARRQVEKAQDIVIAEALSDTGPAVNGIASSEAKVVSVIKGNRKLGTLALYSDGLRKGRTYLLFNFGNYPGKIDFATNGDLAVIELPPRFDLESLQGKSPLEQVQAVFDARRSWIAWELEQLGRENDLFEKFAPKKTE